MEKLSETLKNIQARTLKAEEDRAKEFYHQILIPHLKKKAEEDFHTKECKITVNGDQELYDKTRVHYNYLEKYLKEEGFECESWSNTVTDKGYKISW